MVLLQSLPELRAPAPGVRLQVLEEERFKRARLRVHFDLPLDDARAARTLLLPVLLQGSAACSSRLAVARRLQEAYGATLNLDADRVGEHFRATLSLSWVGERFLPPGGQVLAELLELAHGLLWEPLRDGAAPFRAATVERERAQLLRQIAALQDDRAHWAEERFVEAMCAGEPYALRSFDSAEAVAAVGVDALEHARLRMLAEAEVTAVAVGPVDAAPVEAWLRERFGARSAPPPLPAVELKDAGPALRETREHLPMEQARFHMGFRYRPAAGLEERTAAGMAAAVLGGGAHGRLFRVVREERSLAYGIYATLRSMKGLMTVAAGIDAGAYEAVRDEVLTQVAALAADGPTEEELELARRARLDRLLGLGDSAGALLGYLERELLLGSGIAPAARSAAIAACAAPAIAAAAAQWRPDLAYLLESGVAGEAA